MTGGLSPCQDSEAPLASLALEVHRRKITEEEGVGLHLVALIGDHLDLEGVLHLSRDPCPHLGGEHPMIPGMKIWMKWTVQEMRSPFHEEGVVGLVCLEVDQVEAGVEAHPQAEEVPHLDLQEALLHNNRVALLLGEVALGYLAVVQTGAPCRGLHKDQVLEIQGQMETIPLAPGSRAVSQK